MLISLSYVFYFQLLWERMYFRWRMNWNDIDEKMQIITQWAAREKELQSKLAQILNQRNVSENSIVEKLDECEIKEN